MYAVCLTTAFLFQPRRIVLRTEHYQQTLIHRVLIQDFTQRAVSWCGSTLKQLVIAYAVLNCCTLLYVVTQSACIMHRVYRTASCSRHEKALYHSPHDRRLENAT